MQVKFKQSERKISHNYQVQLATGVNFQIKLAENPDVKLLFLFHPKLVCQQYNNYNEK